MQKIRNAAFLALLLFIAAGCREQETQPRSGASPKIWKLIAALETNDSRTLEDLVRESPGLLETKAMECGRTPLFLAAASGNVEVLVCLLRMGARVNARDDAGCTPLHVAVENGRLSAAKALIAKGAALSARDRSGYTPLHLAAGRGYEEIVLLLVERGAGLNCQDNLGWTPLMWAVQLWHYESALALIEKGADVNVADREGYSALHLAMGHASEMNEKVINSLIARHASVNARTRRGETPFKLAADYGLRVNMDILAGANADPRLRKIPVEQPGQTPGPPRIPPEGK